MLATAPLSELPELPRSNDHQLKTHRRLNSIPVKRQENEPTIKLEIKASTLAALFADSQICAADFHCLDQSSKQLVMNLCLKTCLSCRCAKSETLSTLSLAEDVAKDQVAGLTS